MIPVQSLSLKEDIGDELRDAIKAAGYVLEDTPQGQKVRKGL